MEKLKKEIRRGLDFHINDNVTSSGILKGDLIIFDSLFNNRLKTKEEYEILFNYFKDIILIELKDIDIIKKDEVCYESNNLIDEHIKKIINEINIELVVEELLRLNSGKKKMLRANMVYNTYESKDIHLAALIELFHLATLIQDDVIDKAKYRRFKKTINNKYSNKIAILISDILIVKVVLEIKNYLEENITKKDEEYIKYFEKEIHNLITNLIFSERFATEIKDVDDYMKYAVYKTSNLFSFGISSSYISKSYPDVDKKVVENLKVFAKDFGVLFQKIDDFIDYRNDFDLSGKDSVDKINGINNYMYLMLKENTIDEILNILEKDFSDLKKQECSKYYKEELEKMREKLYE